MSSTNNLHQKIDSLARDLQSLSAESAQNDAGRKKLLELTMKATAELEAPIETVWRMILSPHAPAALMVMIRRGIVTDLVKSREPKTAKELSVSCGGDELLIVRMMRPLVALGVFRETDIQTYTSTPISEVLTEPPLTSGYQSMFETATRSLANMPKYLESTGFKYVNSAPGPFQDSHNTPDGMYQWVIKDPPFMSTFNTFMFPVDEILLNGASKEDPESVLLIDIAGGEGHDIEAFHKSFVDVTGKLILQDLPPTIDNIKSLDPAVIRQKYDLFTEQPVKGARGYYLRNIFQSWPDNECILIMKNIAAAMKPKYSKLLVFEWIMPARDTPLYPALLDINMMALLNGMERTEAQWTQLLTQAGLEIVKFWKAGSDSEGLIEAVLK